MRTKIAIQKHRFFEVGAAVGRLALGMVVALGWLGFQAPTSVQSPGSAVSFDPQANERIWFVSFDLPGGVKSEVNMVLHWNEIAVNSIVLVAGNAPASSGYLLGIVQAAVYDAVNSIDGGHPRFIAQIEAPAGASEEAATAQAAHDVLVALLPDQRNSLDAELSDSLATIPDGQSKQDGIEVGQQAADQVMANREGDGRFANIPYEYGEGPGAYQPTPPDFVRPPLVPWMQQVRPFTMTSPDMFRTVRPPDLHSPLWILGYNLTKLLGDINSTARTEAQSEIARFWTEHTPKQWNRGVRGIALEQRLNLADSARLLGLTNVAMADALIGCWDSKFHWSFWRPVTAIWDGGGDPQLKGDPDWLPFQITPNHPEYPAAHGCASGAVVYSLRGFFRTDAFEFAIDSTVDGMTHVFSSFSEALDEVEWARVWGGMHYIFSVRRGAELGEQVVLNIALNNIMQ